MRIGILAALAVFVAVPAQAFDVDGVHSGMTVQEVEQAIRVQGWELLGNNVLPGSYLEVSRDASGTLNGAGPGNFTFCYDRLMAYTRALDLDTEYPGKLRELLEAYGKQPRIDVTHQPWSGPGGGYITSVNTEWKVGTERITLDFSPEERTGDGSLKHHRDASISYVSMEICSKR